MIFIFGKNKKSDLGKAGEKLAAKYLKKQGYKILEFNYKNKTGRMLGEIDIVARDGEEIVFVEVKTREQKIKNKINLPEENITRSKLFKLQKIAQNYIREKQFWNNAYRFDAVSVLFSADEKTAPEIRHLKSIFY